MRWSFPVRVSLFALSLAAASTASAWEFRVLETRGSAYERGLQHGQKFRAEIQRDFNQKGGWGWSVAMRNRDPVMLSGFMKRLEALPGGRELIEEMQGIAEGSGLAFTDIAGLNFTYDLGERTACSMALLPSSTDGPILLNTLDDFPSGRHTQNYPMFVQVAYPVAGHAMITLCNYGTVWAHQGLNDAGLAIGSTSGGLGAPRGGENYEGMYYAVLGRYALQFQESADDVIKLFTANRQISKGINVSVLDRHGKGAIFEYSASAVGVRPTQTNAPLYATNFFQTDKYPPYDKSVEEYDYMKNARARYRRLGELFASMKEPSVAAAQAVVLDENGGQQGQICQGNKVMVTDSANLFVCRDVTAYLYLGYPKESKPVVVRLDTSKKPKEGKPAPRSEQVATVRNTPPKTLKPMHHQFPGVRIVAADPANVACTAKLPQGERRVDLSAGTIMLFTPGKLADVPGDKFTVLYGKLAADRSRFEAAKIITYRNFGSGGRLLDGEGSGRLHQKDGKLSLEYEPGKFVDVTLDGNHRVIVANKVPPGQVTADKPADLYGYTLEPDGDIIATWLNVYLSDEDAKKMRAEAGLEK